MNNDPSSDKLLFVLIQNSKLDAPEEFPEAVMEAIKVQNAIILARKKRNRLFAIMASVMLIYIIGFVCLSMDFSSFEHCYPTQNYLQNIFPFVSYAMPLLIIVAFYFFCEQWQNYESSLESGRS